MNQEKNIKRISKLMSYILRHKPEHIGTQLDENGWLPIDELIHGICGTGIPLDRLTLEEVVETNNKKRFVISEDGLRIRANQGHSIQVELDLQETEPPEFLYHGTVEKFLESIQVQGLQKMTRQHVHLSPDKETAISVGGRRGKPIILTILANKMFDDQHKFYLSANGVWLTDQVDPQYIVEP